MPTRRSAQEEAAIRGAVFDWLDGRQRAGQYEFSHLELKAFHYRGERIPLLDTGRGIRNPATFAATLTLMTTAKAHPYGDEIAADGSIVYSLQRDEEGDNVKLFIAAEERAPMLYLKGIRQGVFVPYYPVVIERVDLSSRHVVLREIGAAVDFVPHAMEVIMDARRYGEAVVRTRQHQRAFRAKVLNAYADQCVVCRLDVRKVLDAAHIAGDTDEHGVPEIWNGMAMCALHHRAYDSDVMGIDADYRIHIESSVMEPRATGLKSEGLQLIHGRQIQLPGKRTHRPSQELLDARFKKFSASLA